MIMQIQLNIPIKYNDMTVGEIAPIYMNLKRIVEEIERAFSNIDENSMTEVYNKKIENLINVAKDTADKYAADIADRNARKVHVNSDVSTSSRTIYNDLVKKNSLILIYPDSEYLEKWATKGFYLSEVGDGYFKIHGESAGRMNFTAVIEEGVDI